MTFQSYWTTEVLQMCKSNARSCSGYFFLSRVFSPPVHLENSVKHLFHRVVWAPSPHLCLLAAAIESVCQHHSAQSPLRSECLSPSKSQHWYPSPRRCWCQQMYPLGAHEVLRLEPTWMGWMFLQKDPLVVPCLLRPVREAWLWSGKRVVTTSDQAGDWIWTWPPLLWGKFLIFAAP